MSMGKRLFVNMGIGAAMFVAAMVASPSAFADFVSGHGSCGGGGCTTICCCGSSGVCCRNDVCQQEV